jgi:Ser/Thr protein kinase RdoA (MazF antagonist)
MSSPIPEIPEWLAALYGVTSEDLRFVTQVQNFIFAYRRGDQELILRLTPETHRSREQVMAEVGWVNDLAARGVPVAAPVPSLDGSFCQFVETNEGKVTAVCFEKAKGEIGDRQFWTPEVFRDWGRLTGRLHRESRQYQPTGGRRSSWDQQLPSVIPESVDDETALERLAQVANRLQMFPKSNDSFGLIHADLHFWNFSILPSGLTVFDFDNCEYNWFVADLGTAVFEATTCGYQKLPREEFIKLFLAEFIDGYEREQSLGDALEYLPLFAKLREICIYLVLRDRWKGQTLSEFRQRFFESLRTAIANDRPFLKL